MAGMKVNWPALKIFPRADKYTGTARALRTVAVPFTVYIADACALRVGEMHITNCSLIHCAATITVDTELGISFSLPPPNPNKHRMVRLELKFRPEMKILVPPRIEPADGDSAPTLILAEVKTMRFTA